MTPSRRALTRVRLGQRRRGPLELPEKHNFPVPQSSSLYVLVALAKPPPAFTA